MSNKHIRKIGILRLTKSMAWILVFLISIVFWIVVGVIIYYVQ